METLTPTMPTTAEDFSYSHTEFGHSQHVEFTISGARTLIESWEQADLDCEPKAGVAAANFYLPFLPELPGDNTPHVRLWKQKGLPNGILIGRLSIRSPLVRIGKWRIPMPRLRTLNITEGGLKALNSATADQQAEYLRQLLADGTIDCISVHRVPLNSEIGSILGKGLRHPGDGNPTVIGHWFTELNDTSGRPVVTNSAKTRSAFRRMDRKLCEFFDNQVQLREFRSREQVADFIKVAARIGASSYQQGIGVGVQDNSWWSKLLGLHADNGNMRAYLLEAKGEPIAYAVGSLWGDTYTGLATSYLPEHRSIAPGTYLLRRMLEQFQQEGVRWFDYGVGDYGYKEIYGTWRREDATLNLYASSPAARITCALEAIVSKTNRTLHRALQSWGLIDRLRHLRRRIAERSARRLTDRP